MIKSTAKRKVQKRHPAVMLVLVVFIANVLAFSGLGGTFAKYVWSNPQTVSTATVASFAFDINGDEIRASNNTWQTFDLFQTAYLTDGNQTVWANNDDNVIAPGTQGKFDILVENKGDVAIKPHFTFGETMLGGVTIPITYSIVPVSGSVASAAGTYTALTTNVDGASIPVNGSGITTVYWQWTFEAAVDVNDTSAGTNDDAALAVAVSCVIDQLN